MTWRGWQVLLVSIVSAFAAASLALLSANQSAQIGKEATRISEETARESEQRWCGVVVALDEAYRTGRPTTPIGQQIADSIAQLRREFGCPSG